MLHEVKLRSGEGGPGRHGVPQGPWLDLTWSPQHLLNGQITPPQGAHVTERPGLLAWACPDFYLIYASGEAIPLSQ